MEKIHSEKEFSQESRNPWSTSSTYVDVGSLRKVINLAERTGKLPVKDAWKDGNYSNEVREKELPRLKSPSVQLIQQLEVLSSLETAFYKVKEMIYIHQLEKETQDLTDPHCLDEKIKMMEELSLHFSAIVDKKEEMIQRLQQPFVGDYISIDADYQSYVVEAIPSLASVLSNLTMHMENMTWSTQFSLENGEMEKILASISSVLAQMQSYYQSLCTSRNLMTKILDDVKKSPN